MLLFAAAVVGQPTVASDIQKLAPGSVVDLFQIDMTSVGGGVLSFHPGKNSLKQDIVWNGQQYVAFPIIVEGFEASGNGKVPRPTLRVANVSGLISESLRTFEDFIGCKVVRIRTLSKYLDAVNFPGGVNPTADPVQEFPREIWYVDRKSAETTMVVEFELAASWDVQGVLLPRRQAIANTCGWLYKGEDCGYAGGPVADEFDIPTNIPSLDRCGKRLTSCKLRFGATAALPYGAFPSVGLVK